MEFYFPRFGSKLKIALQNNGRVAVAAIVSTDFNVERFIGAVVCVQCAICMGGCLCL